MLNISFSKVLLKTAYLPSCAAIASAYDGGGRKSYPSSGSGGAVALFIGGGGGAEAPPAKSLFGNGCGASENVSQVFIPGGGAAIYIRIDVIIYAVT